MSKDSLIANGAQRMNATELRSLIVGAEVSGFGAAGMGSIYEIPNADGTLGGSVVGSQGANSFSGTWSIDPSGAYCVDRKGNGDYGFKDRACVYWYKAGSDYYEVRGTIATKRSVKRL